MTIILMDGSFMTARRIEISSDHSKLIIDDDIVIDIDDVLRIVRCAV